MEQVRNAADAISDMTAKDPLSQKLGLSIDCEPIEVVGRELAPPPIKYNNDRAVTTVNGTWKTQRLLETSKRDIVIAVALVQPLYGPQPVNGRVARFVLRHAKT